MTQEAIHRRTNVPLELILHALAELQKPDPKSRSGEGDGARIKLLDSHRDWGWQILNYDHYRELRDAESMRAYFRDQKRKKRRELKDKTDKKHTANSKTSAARSKTAKPK